MVAASIGQKMVCKNEFWIIAGKHFVAGEDDLLLAMSQS